MHWTTNNIEQGHASAALVLRSRKGYGRSMLTQRAFLHMMRFLFTALDAKGVAKQSRLDERARVLASKNPRKITGRHVFLVTARQH